MLWRLLVSASVAIRCWILFSDWVFYLYNIQRFFPSFRRCCHAWGILTIFTELTIEMMNLVGPVMSSKKVGSAVFLHCTESVLLLYIQYTITRCDVAIGSIRLIVNVQSWGFTRTNQKLFASLCIYLNTVHTYELTPGGSGWIIGAGEVR